MVAADATDGGSGGVRSRKVAFSWPFCGCPWWGLTTLLSMVVLGALVVAFEAWVGCLVQFVIVCVV